MKVTWNPGTITPKEFVHALDPENYYGITATRLGDDMLTVSNLPFSRSTLILSAGDSLTLIVPTRSTTHVVNVTERRIECISICEADPSTHVNEYRALNVQGG